MNILTSTFKATGCPDARQWSNILFGFIAGVNVVILLVAILMVVEGLFPTCLECRDCRLGNCPHRPRGAWYHRVLRVAATLKFRAPRIGGFAAQKWPHFAPLGVAL
ncbi:hypothetical protein JAAARDRAFT_31214 [Jaapia argillacea MUCL 33604]|uniref:Uncharacterized protein n=1 Tax=Jaapia argillacea MUCL 33604 TaxID=933084 RepID=A0A067Q6D8_9AGAM|nr:hypothetical protein JAAARDRAFT_31214 [Jaapia argillacea MUCL 33604]